MSLLSFCKIIYAFLLLKIGSFPVLKMSFFGREIKCNTYVINVWKINETIKLIREGDKLTESLRREQIPELFSSIQL